MKRTALITGATDPQDTYLAEFLLKKGPLDPTIGIADLRPKVRLTELIPRDFKRWLELPTTGIQTVDPQQTELRIKPYTQTLPRSYINNQRVLVVLSFSYGANQSDSMQLHYPEECYPTQGFQLQQITKDILDTNAGVMHVKQLLATLGNRFDPITYWPKLGDKVVYGGMETKLAQPTYGFNGEILAALVFRVSSISTEARVGYELQTRIAKNLVASLPVATTARLTGLTD